MREFVQSLKNRIIFKMNGQSQSGLPIFRNKDNDKLEIRRFHYGF